MNPGETLTITFNLVAGQDYDDVIAALALSGANPGVDVAGGLRIGIHVQGYAGDTSEAFVNRVPDGGTTMSLLGLGLAGIGLLANGRHLRCDLYERWQRRRLSITGGITCIWQVSGRSEIPFRDWMRLDLRYVACRNLLVDLKILARTLPAVISGRGAC